jgi:hypothetical protein
MLWVVVPVAGCEAAACLNPPFAANSSVRGRVPIKLRGEKFESCPEIRRRAVRHIPQEQYSCVSVSDPFLGMRPPRQSSMSKLDPKSYGFTGEGTQHPWVFLCRSNASTASVSAFRAVARASTKFAESTSAFTATSKFALAMKTHLMASETATERCLRSRHVGQSTFIF